MKFSPPSALILVLKKWYTPIIAIEEGTWIERTEVNLNRLCMVEREKNGSRTSIDPNRHNVCKILIYISNKNCIRSLSLPSVSCAAYKFHIKFPLNSFSAAILKTFHVGQMFCSKFEFRIFDVEWFRIPPFYYNEI